MSVIQPDPQWAVGLDVSALAANWETKTVLGTDTVLRGSVTARALAVLLSRLHHLVAYTPRVLLCKIHKFASRPTHTADTTPLYRWRYRDTVADARDVGISVLAIPRTSDPAPTSAAYWQRSDNSDALDANTKGSQSEAVVASPTVARVYADTATYARGAASGSEINEGLAVAKGYSPLSVLVQERPIGLLDTSVHTTAGFAPQYGDPVLGGSVLEQLRAALHSLRTTKLPVWNWSAYKDGASYATPAANTASGKGIAIQSTTLTNIWDFTTTGNTAGTRSASVAGIVAHVRYCGLRTTSKLNDVKLKVQCRVYGKVSANTGTVRFIGPDTWASNSTDISISTTLGWHGSSSNYVYLDTGTVTDTDDSNTKRAKVDTFGSVSNGADTLYIYAISLFAEYGL